MNAMHIAASAKQEPSGAETHRTKQPKLIRMNAIPYGRQTITGDDIEAVVAALQSTHLTQGPRIGAFENDFARYVDSPWAVAVSNGTAALHLAVSALEVRPGDKVITTPITFVATANAVRFCGGEPVFADIDPETYLLDVKAVRALLEAAPKGTYKGIIPVSFAGRAVNLEQFRKLADEFGLWIIEDACHSPGGWFTDSQGHRQRCGNGHYADLSVFSFHPVKHIACGEGGMVTTGSEALRRQILRLRSHGITKGDDPYTNPPSFAWAAEGDEAPGSYPGWYMEMQQLGYNYRITDIQAALGSSQLRRAEEGLVRRREIAQTYFDAFRGKSYVKGQSGVTEGHAYHLYVIEAENRNGLFNHLRRHHIYAQLHYIPAHLMPYYRQFGWKEGDLPHAENYYRRCVSLPVFPGLTGEEQAYVIEKISEFYE